MIVLDASVVVEQLLRPGASPAIEARLFDSKETLHAPHLLDVEVAQVLRRYTRVGELEEHRGRTALSDLEDMPITRYPHGLLLPRIWQLRENLTAYDATYVSLAELLGATLLTRDKKIAVAPGHVAQIELI